MLTPGNQHRLRMLEMISNRSKYITNLNQWMRAETAGGYSFCDHVLNALI